MDHVIRKAEESKRNWNCQRVCWRGVVGGGGGFNLKKLPWEGLQFFLEQHIVDYKYDM